MGIGRGKAKFGLVEVASLAEERQPIYDGETKTLFSNYHIIRLESFNRDVESLSRLTLP
ncbi:MAG: hypothetical protein ACE5IW_05105 [bacterium]